MATCADLVARGLFSMAAGVRLAVRADFLFRAARYSSESLRTSDMSTADVLRRLYASRRYHWGPVADGDRYSIVGSEDELKALVVAADELEAALAAARYEADLAQQAMDEMAAATEARKSEQMQVEALQAEVAHLEPMRQRAADIERLTAERDALRAEMDALRAQEPVAWAHSDGRVVPASTMSAALRDGGAMRSSLAGYTIPLYAAPAVQPLTDEQINDLMPPADGTAQTNVKRVEVLPGVMVTKFDEVDAWSLPLVREVARAVERAHGIGQPAGEDAK